MSAQEIEKHDENERSSILRFFHWLGKHELGTLTVITSVIAAIWAFAELADEVMEEQTGWFDETILLAMRSDTDLSDPIGPLWLEELGRDLTALGGVGVLTLLCLTVIGYLLLAGKWRAAVIVALSVSTGMVLSLLLKDLFDRPRPDLVPHGSIVYTTSFPSGHSMMAAVVYLTLAALLARVQQRKRIKAYVLLVALTATLLVGLSRIYLGVHWPTDVLAGWTAGAAWALCWWLAARGLQRRGKMEEESEEGFTPIAADG
ncbi:phosphatase PAP2 family protein [Nitrosococcus wardiae]|uniref:undecaprenyl-diphosphate phosphatase n=1 Tax=Nitrosococcus wardiae TaxID=1814290 RepID=A0A4P7BWB9_9GAMM|nr:phosphatase PAP2 family protein [Nitrosococcus wardiae]QBQ54358.1 phosphatase PAP2 family protein [Nitrosococcus wardiae]